MRKAHLPLAPLLLPLLALACETPTVHMVAADQSRAERELPGQHRFLRVSVYAGPLWSDTEKVFVTDSPADELDLVEAPNGKPMRPPRHERILPPGTPVKIRSIEFPGTFTMAQRVLVTPRYHPWVYLTVADDKRPYVIVLPQEVKTFDDVRVELERYLTPDDPRPALAALPAESRDLILRKEIGPGMSARALEMSWGLPERKRIDRPAGTEEWFWAGGKRHVYLREDRVEKIDRS
jgi:hypothetical protein